MQVGPGEGLRHDMQGKLNASKLSGVVGGCSRLVVAVAWMWANTLLATVTSNNNATKC
jgi:hypothetical protein